MLLLVVGIVTLWINASITLYTEEVLIWDGHQYLSSIIQTSIMQFCYDDKCFSTTGGIELVGLGWQLVKGTVPIEIWANTIFFWFTFLAQVTCAAVSLGQMCWTRPKRAILGLSLVPVLIWFVVFFILELAVDRSIRTYSGFIVEEGYTLMSHDFIGPNALSVSVGGCVMMLCFFLQLVFYHMWLDLIFHNHEYSIA